MWKYFFSLILLLPLSNYATESRLREIQRLENFKKAVTYTIRKKWCPESMPVDEPIGYSTYKDIAEFCLESTIILKNNRPSNLLYQRRHRKLTTIDLSTPAF